MSRFQPGNPGGPGRPRGRIAKFRALLGTATRDGAEMVEHLTAIWRDPTNPVKERREALALGLAYLLGRPEVAVDVTADVTARPGAALDGPRVLAMLSDTAVRELAELADADPTLLLEPGDPDADDE